MNHKFQSSQLDKSLCQECKYPFIAHTNLAECESCSAKGECDFSPTSPDILMCKSCLAREKEIQSEISNQVESASNEVEELIISEREQRITELKNRLLKELPIDARSFHVSNIESIVNIEEDVRHISELSEPKMTEDEIAFTIADLVLERQQTMQKHLIEMKKKVLEDTAGMTINQRYLNLLVPTLRAEVREKFKQYDMTYSPVSPRLKAIEAPKVKMSASDKALASYAKMMGITYEQAQKALTTVMKSKGVECTCSTTPGICKIHA